MTNASLATWAAARGLTFSDHDLLPPWTPALEQALGVGEHRAGLVVERTSHSFTSTGGFTKRPERGTLGVARGELSGGRAGLVAHHRHLEYDSSGDSGSWICVPETVVVLRVPAVTRVARDLRGGRAPSPPRSLFGGAIALTPPPGSVELAGWRWRTSPAEDAATLQARLAPRLAERFAALPADTRVELWDGNLAVISPGELTAAPVLDELCGAAAALAVGLDDVAERMPALEPERFLGAERIDPQAPTLGTGPNSVAAAKTAYLEQLAAGGSLGRARRRRARGAAAGAAANAATDAIAAGGVVGALVLGPAQFLLGHRSRRRGAEEELSRQAAVWALNGFMDHYGAERRLQLEDRDAVRRRLRTSLPGVPLRVLHGELAPGTTGRLMLWIDRTDRSRSDYAVGALIPRPAGAIPPLSGYQTEAADGQLLVWRPIAAEDRSAAELDALRQALADLRAG